MKVTNLTGLPDAIYQAVLNDGYSKGDADYSITGLLKPARMGELERQYWDTLTEDTSDRIWSLLGQVIHGILERAETVAIPEKRWYGTLGGKRISGGMDRLLLKDGLLQDYKFTTVYKVAKGLPVEFIQQLNCYQWLLAQNGVVIQRAEIVAIFRDWSKLQAKRDITYPRQQVAKLQVPLWPLDECESFIRGRIAAHEAAKDALPLCSDEERWAKNPIFAVVKEGAKKALALYSDRIEAEAAAVEATAKGKAVYGVVLRPGANTRCESYCSVSEHCSQFKELCGQLRS